ncbi:hypothetical protein D9757_003478 [Collybiopsis confluens]|uniref:RNA-dependent RNA polymerase n=1 Tax=Collybiopsis confluens TaxID=2823264 RepID=A0A8H5MCR9_9AGAR|nr:hypothetical protein D9757_003478 [Collybiopsis confluens]
MLLEDLGVPYEAFKRLQDEAIQRTLSAPDSLKTAAQLLETYGLGTGVDNLIESETFHRSMLDYAIHHIFRGKRNLCLFARYTNEAKYTELKHRSRIPIEGAWNLVGVADIRGELEDGEIFACVKSRNAPLEYIEGDPDIPLFIRAMFNWQERLGDYLLARVLLASLLSIRLFSRRKSLNALVTGDRPLTSMLGGGDLDGVCVLLITALFIGETDRCLAIGHVQVIPLDAHPDLRPERTADAAEYARPERKQLKQDCTRDDITDFVVEYFHSDVVGLIATRWLTIADQNPDGIFHDDCYTLAKLHSDAVDFPRTGQSVDISRIPKEHFRTRPDRSAPENIKPDSSSYYKSQRAIGKLARAISLDEIEPTSTVQRPDPKQGTFSNHKMRPGNLENPLPILREVETFLQEDALYLLLQSHLNKLGLALDLLMPKPMRKFWKFITDSLTSSKTRLLPSL